MKGEFSSLYSHGFFRAAVCIPSMRVADPKYNAERTLALAKRASDTGAALALFPELGLSGYTCDDLFHQEALLAGCLDSLQCILQASSSIRALLIVGIPIQFSSRLYNCAAIIHRGCLLGLVPKSYLPNYREFYEKRQFSAAREALRSEIELFGQTVPFGSDLIFSAETLPSLRIHVEICEDLWTPLPPSSYAALAGATVLCNLSASNITIGKADYRRNLCAGQSGRCVSAYLYSAAGPGESTTDLAWDGHALIYENSELLAESERFSSDEQSIIADIDGDRLVQERMRLTSFGDSITDHRARLERFRTIPFPFEIPQDPVPLQRAIARFPFAPDNPAERDERCSEAYRIQVQGLKKRLLSARINKIVIGVSGGLDPTHALIVAAQAMDELSLPRENILAYSLPGFATSEQTRENALGLMRPLRVTGEEISIVASSEQMLADIRHPYAAGAKEYDIAYENVQAGERTSHLFRLANLHGAIVLGTGDLSELALGWCTYGVGDQMSHYNVNASVPKTLIQSLLRWTISAALFDDETNAILLKILATEISPELIPPSGDSADKKLQSTEEKIGPYELQDFHLYYLSRYGMLPSKTAFLCHAAWSDRSRGTWPDSLPLSGRHEYDLPTIKKWLRLFLYRFFQTSQFKRSAMPNGPKVGSGGSLSPRGDWRAPSDAEAAVWLAELDKNVPDAAAVKRSG